MMIFETETLSLELAETSLAFNVALASRKSRIASGERLVTTG